MCWCYSQQFVIKQVKDSLCMFPKMQDFFLQHFSLLNDFIMKHRINVISIHFQHKSDLVV